MSDPNEVKQKYKEFLELLPLTLALAGLPQTETGKYYTAEQIEARAMSVRSAYKAARQAVRDCIRG